MNTACTGGVLSFAGHRTQQRRCVVEAGDLPRQTLEGKATRREEIQRGAIGRRVDAERAEHAQLLVDDEVRVEAGRVGRAARPRQHDRPARACQPHRLTERGGRLRGDVDDDVRERARYAPKRRDGILALHVDREVGTELRGRGERLASRAPLPVTMTNPAPADFAAAQAESPRTPGPEHRHDVARLRLGDGDRPPDPRAERVEQRRRHRSRASGPTGTSSESGARYWYSA